MALTARLFAAFVQRAKCPLDTPAVSSAVLTFLGLSEPARAEVEELVSQVLRRKWSLGALGAQVCDKYDCADRLRLLSALHRITSADASFSRTEEHALDEAGNVLGLSPELKEAATHRYETPVAQALAVLGLEPTAAVLEIKAAADRVEKAYLRTLRGQLLPGEGYQLVKRHEAFRKTLAALLKEREANS
jgi:hypothetical protein